jgi:hypothetical protein
VWLVPCAVWFLAVSLSSLFASFPLFLLHFRLWFLYHPSVRGAVRATYYIENHYNENNSNDKIILDSGPHFFIFLCLSGVVFAFCARTLLAVREASF